MSPRAWSRLRRRARSTFGEVTRNLAAKSFAFAPLAPLELAGKTLRVGAWRLVGELTERARLQGGEAPLVGRGREVAALALSLDEAAAGSGRLMALVGEAGIGKSRLALEARLLAERSGFTTIWGTARSYAEPFPYYLLAQLVGELLPERADGSLDALLVAADPKTDPSTIMRWAAILRDIRGDAMAEDRAVLGELTPSGRQRLLVQALGNLLTARSAESPQLIVLDDLHWSDASSVAVIDELVQLVSDRGWSRERSRSRHRLCHRGPRAPSADAPAGVRLQLPLTAAHAQAGPRVGHHLGASSDRGG